MPFGDDATHALQAVKAVVYEQLLRNVWSLVDLCQDVQLVLQEVKEAMLQRTTPTSVTLLKE